MAVASALKYLLPVDVALEVCVQGRYLITMFVFSLTFSQIWLRLNIPFPVVEIAVRRELYTFLVFSTYHSGLCAHVRDRERSRRRPSCVSTSGLLCYPCCSLCSVWGLAFRGP